MDTANNMDGDGAHDAYYKVLEMAVSHNNQALVLDWLENRKDQQDYQWRGNLLSQAAYCHSVDVVRCIVSFGNCDGQSTYSLQGVHGRCMGVAL